MEETTVLQAYLTDFGMLYMSMRAMFWPVLVKGLGVFAVFGVIRLIFKYATASPIGPWDRSTYIVRAMEYIMYTYFESPKAQKKYKEYDENHKYIGIKGGHLGGTVIDMAIIGIVLFVVIWIWPLIIVMIVLFGPIQLCRNHFMKKKKFIANLKGKELDI